MSYILINLINEHLFIPMRKERPEVDTMMTSHNYVMRVLWSNGWEPL